MMMRIVFRIARSVLFLGHRQFQLGMGVGTIILTIGLKPRLIYIKQVKLIGLSSVAGDHVAGGKRFKSYRCKRNTGAFTWSSTSGPQFHYKDYTSALDSAAQEGGTGFAQEMMIHNGNAVKTTRPLGNRNVFRALCLNSDNQLALYESQGVISFGNFIDALLSVGVKEALYTDMGQSWNYCFYRDNNSDTSPKYLHAQSLPYASNFVTIKIK